ncbi:hypothetical protein [Vibrio campbellii]
MKIFPVFGGRLENGKYPTLSRYYIELALASRTLMMVCLVVLNIRAIALILSPFFIIFWKKCFKTHLKNKVSLELVIDDFLRLKSWRLSQEPGHYPISAESPDLELRLCPVRPSEIMNSNINDTVERFLYQKR